jgi:hypothetical protein
MAAGACDAERNTNNRSKQPRSRVDRLVRQMNRQFDRIERTKADKKDVERAAAETRRHIDIVAESLRDDIRLFADALVRDSQRLDQHDVRIGRLERRLI